MARKIEQLLNVIADFARFSGDDARTAFRTNDILELSENELEFVAAAAATPYDWEQATNDESNTSV